MGSTVTTAERSTEGKAFDHVRPAMAKAALHDQALSIEMSAIVRDALVRHFGSLKAAAIEMDIDQGQLTRELDAGKLNLTRLQRCGAAFLVKFGALMVEHMQPLSSPKVRGFQLLREIEQRVNEVRQLLEHCA